MSARDAVLLKAYVNATDRWNGRPLYEVIVAEALASGLAGASVFPVTCSYGAGLRIHDTASDYQFADAPVVIEIVDDPPRVEALLDVIGPMLSGGLLTVEAVRVGDHDSDAARD